jgi:hypothetical protein
MGTNHSPVSDLKKEMKSDKYCDSLTPAGTGDALLIKLF